MTSDTDRQLIKARARNNTIILAFANFPYLEVLLNWIISISRLGISNYVVVSLDQETHQYLFDRAFPSILSPLDGDLSQLWTKRLLLFQELCLDGINFVHSDADAVWLKNPLPEYFDSSASQIIASEGTTWPPDVLKHQGFVLCCGLFYMQSCRENSLILDRIIEDVKRTGDDQVSLNRVIAAIGVRWAMDPSKTYELQANETPFVCYKEVLYGRSEAYGIRISVLPHHLFQRIHMPGGDAYVKHLLSTKTSESKMSILEESGCLFIKSGWQDVDFSASSISLIAK